MPFLVRNTESLFFHTGFGETQGDQPFVYTLVIRWQHLLSRKKSIAMENLLLAALPHEERKRLSSFLEEVTLENAVVLIEPEALCTQE